MPNDGCLPHTSHTAAMTGRTSDARERLTTGASDRAGTGVADRPPTRGAGPGRSGARYVSAADDDARAPRRRRPAGRRSRASATPCAPTRSRINRLNVYPVPDGDTGTNMALTLESVVAELDGRRRRPGRDVQGHQPRLAHGRPGQLRRDPVARSCGAWPTWWREPTRSTAPTLGRGARRGAPTAAYGAVMRPVEGTILTVVREAAEAAPRRPPTAAPTCVDVLEAARGAGGPTRWPARPSMLPVLTEAGVVDAGGAGFLLLLDVAAPRRRRPARCPSPTPIEVADGPGRRPRPHAGARRRRRRRRHRRPALRGHVLPRGARRRRSRRSRTCGPASATRSSWSAATASGTATSTPTTSAPSIEAALDVGRPRKIRVTDLLEQVEEERWVREADAGADEPAVAHDAGRRRAVVAVATGDGIRRIFHSLGVQGIVTGGQTMNPSTAELLEAVEAAPADEVVILPEQQEHHPGGRAGRRPDRQDGPGRADPGRSPRASPRCWPTTRRPTVDDNAEAMAEAAASSRGRRGHPGGPRLDLRRSGPIAEGDWLGIARDGIRAVGADLGRRGHRLLDELVDRRATRSSRSSRARAPTRGRSPATSRSGSHEHRPGVDGRGAPRRPAALPVPLRHRVAGAERMARRPRRSSPSCPSPSSKGVGPKRPRRWRKLGVETVLDLLTYYPRRYLDRTNQAPHRRPRDRRGGDGAGHGRSASRARRTRNRRSHGRSSTSPTAPAGCSVTFFNQPWRERQLQPGIEVVLFGKARACYRGRRQMTNPVVDLVGDKTGRIVAVYPQSEKAGVMTLGRRRVDGRGAAPGRATFADPVPADVLRPARTSSTARPAFHDIHVPESMARPRARPAAGWCSTSCCACS